MNSALYRGWVRHRRHSPKAHAFQYAVFMVLLDLDKLEDLQGCSALWSTRRFAALSFRREDHFGDPERPLKGCVLDLVEAGTGARPGGAVMLLTNPRVWGYCFNPISIYYCYEADNKRVAATVAEVTNTPWGERHCYVLSGKGQPSLKVEFAKKLHVSPFMSMEQTYRWRGRPPGKTLAVHLEACRQDAVVLDATLALQRRPFCTRALAAAVIAHPFLTAKIITAIHWQAMRLWLKGLPLIAHPGVRKGALRRLNT